MMADMTFVVPGISCGHCVNAVTREVSALNGVTRVDVDLPTKRVTVTASAEVGRDVVLNAIRDAGYDEILEVSGA
jgi:copper chaperone